ncbi:MAG: Hsp20/alpha crystallin family protein [bacterium]|nr:MAG: Hsp20/alpha crystallin family protein [bacterium]
MAIERFRRQRPTLWEPFFGLRGLQEEMNRLFSDFYGEPSGTAVSMVNPAVDVVDTKDSIRIHVELPGIAKEDVEISLKDDILTIRGEKKREKEEKGENRYYVERSFGSFSRTMSLPGRVKNDKVKATFKNGVLEIDLPKAEEEKSREIQVKVE